MNRDTLILAGLTLLTSSLAVGMAAGGYASKLEAISFVTGAVCVWLTVKENVWNFPIGLLNVATFSVVFFRAGLFADAGLQVVYFALGVIGWYAWLYGGRNRTPLRVTRAPRVEVAVVCLTSAVLTLVLWRTLHVWGGSASFFDALTTALSLGAQWFTNRKRLECWILWIVVDVIYVPLYVYKGLHLTAILYTVFLAMAVMGLIRWRATWREKRTNEPNAGGAVAGAGAA
jgi:nicotinamide mononucleotide transporter